MRGLIWGVVASVLLMIVPAQADPKFEAFIQGLWPRVKAAGISRSLFDRAFSGITEPDQRVLELARKQPEFTSTTSSYLAKAVTPIRIETGQSQKSSQASLLAAIEKKYGVDRHVLLGIWGMESNFGKDKGSMRVMRSLATLIYSGRKRDFANQQLISAFRILDKGLQSPDNFVGSWAAAMGHTQFIPSSYLAYAVDWTGDGKRDIWGSTEDALASTANYLARAGWKSDRPWGWEVVLPQGFDRSLIGRRTWRSIEAWQKLGVKASSKSGFGSSKAEAFVMIPQGIGGPSFLVTRNFKALMDYNFSHSYALAVGHLADRIRGGEPIQAAWPDVSVDLTFDNRVEMQKRLSARGFSTGGADGRFGAQTYEAIIAYQRKQKLFVDGKPSRELLSQLRQN